MLHAVGRRDFLSTSGPSPTSERSATICRVLLGCEEMDGYRCHSTPCPYSDPDPPSSYLCFLAPRHRPPTKSGRPTIDLGIHRQLASDARRDSLHTKTPGHEEIVWSDPLRPTFFPALCLGVSVPWCEIIQLSITGQPLSLSTPSKASRPTILAIHRQLASDAEWHLFTASPNSEGVLRRWSRSAVPRISPTTPAGR